MSWNLIGVEKIEKDTFMYHLFFKKENKDKLINFLDSIYLPNIPFLGYKIYERGYFNNNENEFFIEITNDEYEKIKNKLIILTRKEKLKNVS